MSIASQITRIQQDRNTIRNKLVELGLATNTDNLDVLAESIDNIVDNGNVTVNVKEGETYTIPAGYHSGSGTVSGVAGGGNYSLQSKAAITPTKKQQQITPDDGFYGLSDVTIGAIPDAYQDVTSVTAAAADVLSGKVIVSSTGQILTGSMTNNGAVDKTLTTADASYTVPGGYHSGAGTVKIVPEDKTVTPTKDAQTITATTGKVLNQVEVEAIPDAYQDVTGVTATAATVLQGSVFVDSEGNEISGTIPKNMTMNRTLDTTSTSHTVAAGYYATAGTINISLEEKSATPTKAQQNIIPSTGKVLSKVTVAAIPDEYQVVTGVTATADKVLVGSVFVDAEGTEVDGTMPNRGAVDTTLTVAETTYTIPAGYHDGKGQVDIVLEEKSATPTKSQQTVTPTSGKVLSKVTVAAIPDEYQVVTGVTATADKVLTGSVFVDAQGNEVDGTMPAIAPVDKTLSISDALYIIPAGYHDGTGEVSIIHEEKSATPTKSEQVITPSGGMVLSKVTVAAIPAAYQDVTKVDAEAQHVLAGKKIVSSTGEVVTGSMANQGSKSMTIDGLTSTSVAIPAGFYDGTGTVSLTSDIEDALAAI